MVLNIQPPSAINSTPVVSFSHTNRIEVNDTLHIEASDQTGIVTMGYEVRRAPGGTIDANAGRLDIAGAKEIVLVVKLFVNEPAATAIPRIEAASRVMFGGDWPVCTLAGNYSQVLQIPADYLGKLSTYEQAAVWGGNDPNDD